MLEFELFFYKKSIFWFGNKLSKSLVINDLNLNLFRHKFQTDYCSPVTNHYYANHNETRY